MGVPRAGAMRKGDGDSKEGVAKGIVMQGMMQGMIQGMQDTQLLFQQMPDVVMAPASDINPSERKWLKQWVPQDTVLNPGKLMTLKWVTEDMVAHLNAMTAAEEEDEAEAEHEVLYLCTSDGCGKAFADVGSLRKHAHTHGEKQFICHYDGCGKRFVDSSKLKRHFLIHTGEKHFTCPFEGCGKAFSLDFNLRSHMRTHTGENYHACPYVECGKRYAHEYKLKAHIRNHHDKSLLETTPPPMPVEREKERKKEKEYIVTPKTLPPRPEVSSVDRPFACPYEGCDKRYIHEYKLNLHLRNSHSDENLEYEETPIGRGGSEGEDDVDEGSDQDMPPIQSNARGSGRGKLKIIPKKETVNPKRKRGSRPKQKVVDLNLSMRLPAAPSYQRGGHIQHAAPEDSEGTEDEGENTEDEEYGGYSGGGRERDIVVEDDEETEDDGD